MKILEKKICDLTIKAMSKIKYFNLGTVEYLYNEGNFFFMEMNTRLQVEHTISEEVYNIDIVKEQISVSSGQKLSICQNNIKKMVTQLNVELMQKTQLHYYPQLVL